MSFLGSRDKLPMSTVTSAGTSLVFKNTEYAQRFIPLLSPAQCLYVLTDDNPPAIDELRSNGAYVACLLTIARPEQPGSAQETKKGKGKELGLTASRVRVYSCVALIVYPLR